MSPNSRQPCEIPPIIGQLSFCICDILTNDAKALKSSNIYAKARTFRFRIDPENRSKISQQQGVSKV